MKISKYFTYLKTGLQQAMIKKFDLFGYITTSLIAFLASYLFWRTVYEGVDIINGYTFSEMLVYLILVNLLKYINESNILNDVAYDIRKGEISGNLLKPHNIHLEKLSRLIGSKIYYILIVIPGYILIGILLSTIYGNIEYNLINMLAGFILIFIGFFINFYLDLTIGYLGFWFAVVWFLSHLKSIIVKLLGGRYFPLNLLPDTLAKINFYLPFRLIYFTPLDYITGNRSVSEYFLKDVLIAFFWLLIFIVLANLVFVKGVKKYEAFGN